MVKHVGTCELETKRLILRKFKRDDAVMVFNNWASDEEVTRYVAWPIHHHIGETTKVLIGWEMAYQHLTTYQWAIVLKETQDVIGSISLFNIVNLHQKEGAVCEFGYCLSRTYWNQGITTEASCAILAFAFEVVGFTRVKARHDVLNVASGRVMQKLGMTYDRLLKNACQNSRRQWIDCKVYQIQKEEFFKSFQSNIKGGM